MTTTVRMLLVCVGIAYCAVRTTTAIRQDRRVSNATSGSSSESKLGQRWLQGNERNIRRIEDSLSVVDYHSYLQQVQEAKEKNGHATPPCIKGSYLHLDGRRFFLGVSCSKAGLTWAQANSQCQACKGDFTELASVDSADVTKMLLSKWVGKEPGGSGVWGVWIGLDRMPGGKYTKWTDGTDLIYTNWANHEPTYQYDGKEETKVAMWFSGNGETGKWKDFPADYNNTNIRYYLCQTKPATEWPCSTSNGMTPGYKHSSGLYSGYQLVYCHDGRTWVEAEHDCIQKGGHLISINSKQEQLFVWDTVLDGRDKWYDDYNTDPTNLNSNGITDFWIGLRTNTMGKCKDVWSDGSRVEYTNFYQGFDSQVCERTSVQHGGEGMVLTTNYTGAWINMKDRALLKGYICEMPLYVVDDRSDPIAQKIDFLEQFVMAPGNCSGYDMLPLPLVFSLQQCAAACRRSTHCDGFVFHKTMQTAGNCYPKKAMMKRWCRTPAIVEDTQIYSYYLKHNKTNEILLYYSGMGGDCVNRKYEIELKNRTLITIVECARLCWLHEKCCAFVFNFGDEHMGCHLKQHPLNWICPNLVHNGPMSYTFNFRHTDAWDVFTDFDKRPGTVNCPADKVVKFVTPKYTVSQCGDRCRLSRSCFGFTYDTRSETRRCSFILGTCGQLPAKQPFTYTWMKKSKVMLDTRSPGCSDRCDFCHRSDWFAVCGSDKIIYENTCEMACAMCKTGTMISAKPMVYCTGVAQLNIPTSLYYSGSLLKVYTCEDACLSCASNQLKIDHHWMMVSHGDCVAECRQNIKDGSKPLDKLHCRMGKFRNGNNELATKFAWERRLSL